MVQHIWLDSRECEIHAPKFTHKFTLDSQIHEFTLISTVSLSHGSQSLSSHLLLTMSQQTMSQLASLASRPDPAADTLAR